MQGMFQECISLTTLDISNFDTSNVTSMGGIFSGCRSLTTLDLSNVDASILKTWSIFSEMPNAITIIVKDKVAQDVVIEKKESWTTENVIIKS